MWAEERQDRIMEILRRERRAEADALASMLDVSRETIRRDLILLEQDGQVQRTHGGALIAQSVAEEPFSSRVVQRTGEKRAIAAAAATLVEAGQCCFIDAGSTTSAFAQALAGVPGVSVITNSFEVAMAMRAHQPEAEVLLLGGTLGREVPATFGGTALAQLAHLRADIAFVSPVGIAAEGVSYFDMAEADLARVMLAQARRRIVLADASKCGVVSRVVVAPCADVDVLVTDCADAQRFRASGVGQVLAVGDQAGQGRSKPRSRS